MSSTKGSDGNAAGETEPTLVEVMAASVARICAREANGACGCEKCKENWCKQLGSMDGTQPYLLVMEKEFGEFYVEECKNETEAREEAEFIDHAWVIYHITDSGDGEEVDSDEGIGAGDPFAIRVYMKMALKVNKASLLRERTKLDSEFNGAVPSTPGAGCMGMQARCAQAFTQPQQPQSPVLPRMPTPPEGPRPPDHMSPRMPTPPEGSKPSSPSPSCKAAGKRPMTTAEQEAEMVAKGIDVRR